jgi:two-component system, OmpR family, response regulator
MATAAPRILFIEDDAAIRDMVATALRSEGYEVHAQPDGFALEASAKEFEPDLALLDVRLPVGPNGFSMARMLRAESDLPIVFLTAADEVADRLAGFDAGADDYVAKPFSVAELLARVRAVLKRSGRINNGPLKVGDLVIDEERHEVRSRGEVLDLKHKEFEILVALARKPGRVLTKPHLLSDIWGMEEYDPNLVEVQVSSLRKKLAAVGCGALIQTRRGCGYTLRP